MFDLKEFLWFDLEHKKNKNNEEKCKNMINYYQFQSRFLCHYFV